MTVRVTVRKAELDRLLRGPDGPVWAHIGDLARKTENHAKSNAPVDEGTYRSSISTAMQRAGRTIVARVGSPLEYAMYIELGTGIYGPKGSPITPKSGKYLVFEPSRSMGPLRAGSKHGAKGKRGGLVFARSVRGSPRRDVLFNALTASVPYTIRRLTG